MRPCRRSPSRRALLGLLAEVRAAGCPAAPVHVSGDPAADVACVTEVRRAFPDLELLVDAEGAYDRHGAGRVGRALADDLQISRGPVREAFKMLRAEGLLTEEPHRGTFVVSISPQDVRDIYGLRAAIEGAAARLLCRAGDAGTIARLEAAADAIATAAATGDAVAVAHADLAFHETLCELSGNLRLLETFRRHVPVLRGLLRLDERIMPSIEHVADQHRPVVAAIRAGDEAEAVRLVTEHSEQAGELLADLLEHGG